MTKQLQDFRRRIGTKVFAYDSRYGAYGAGTKAQGKKAAQERASDIRKSGRLARVTLERLDYGIYWVVWRQIQGATRK